MTNLATRTFDEHETKARKDFANNFNVLMRIMGEYKTARTAMVANNRTHGYEAQYNESEYVAYQDRNEDWASVDTALNAVYDDNSDAYYEAGSQVALAFSTLDWQQRKELMENVKGYFNPDSEPASVH